MSLAFSPLEEYYLRLEPQRTRRRQAVLLQIRDQIYGSSVKVSTSEFFLLFGCWKPLFRSKFLDQIRIQSPLQFGVKQFNHPIWCCPQSITFQTETIGPFFLEKEKKRIENYLKIVVIIFTFFFYSVRPKPNIRLKFSARSAEIFGRKFRPTCRIFGQVKKCGK